jgi:ribonuclease HII
MSARVKYDTASLPEKPDLFFETPLWENGLQWIAGIDEAGRGALAGPVSVGIVILPADQDICGVLSGVKDSKQMSPNDRDFWKKQVLLASAGYAVGFADNTEIDRLGIVNAVNLAVRRGLNCLNLIPEHLLIDYFTIPDLMIPQTALIKGDARSLSIAAASILAKTFRDELMVEMDSSYPMYGLASHKGYGTAMHREKIQAFGLSPIHRKSYHLHGQQPILGV